MRLIVLERLTISYFRCFADPVTVEFPTEPGLRFLGGLNLLEPDLGSNGAGKSSLFDALCWCLYNRSVRGERAADLATWHSNERPEVVAIFAIDGMRHIVSRVGSPDQLTLDGHHVAQDAVDRLMGLSYLRFVHSVLYGQGQALFMDLPGPERAALMDEMMDLGRWLALAEHAGDEVKRLDAEQNADKHRLAYDQGRLDDLLVQIADLQDAADEWERKHAADVKLAQHEYVTADQALRTAEQTSRAIERELEQFPDEVKTNSARDLCSDMHSSLNHWKATQERYTRVGDKPTCPECGQGINHAFVTWKRDEAQQAVEQATQDLDHARGQLESLLQEQQDRREVQRRFNEVRVDQSIRHQELVAARKRLDGLTAERNDWLQDRIGMLTEQHQTGEVAAAALRAVIQQRQTLIERISYWKQGFRQVRLFQMRRILGLLDIEVAAASAQLGVGAWHISFDTQTETKSGSIRPGINVTATNPQRLGDYRSYSFGEAQRIKLAVTLGLASLIQSMAGVYHILEVFDEPTAWLSPEGIDDLLNCLNDRAANAGKAIWLLDPGAMTYPFAEVWRVTKQHRGAMVEQVA